MILNDWGKIVLTEWEQTGVLRANVELDAAVIMPNHFHGILLLTGTMHHAPTRQFSRANPDSLETIMGMFKAAVTRQINRRKDKPDHPIWQRGYHEHIIRNQISLDIIRAYIEANPFTWEEDSQYHSHNN